MKSKIQTDYDLGCGQACGKTPEIASVQTEAFGRLTIGAIPVQDNHDN